MQKESKNEGVNEDELIYKEINCWWNDSILIYKFFL